MTPSVVIAGTGKMGRDIGLALAARGCRVTWLSRCADRLDRFAARTRKRLRRLGTEGAFGLVGEATIPSESLVLESVEEDLDAKQSLFEALRLPEDAALLSNSSSLLPKNVHPRCVGLHFFYPVTMTRLAELIVPAGAPLATVRAARDLIDRCGLDALVQDERTAFAANRLLLPLQAEAARAVAHGADPEDVDEALASDLLLVGPLALMDAVGLDVIAPAVRYYVGRLPASSRGEYGPLVRLLDAMTAAGRRGRKGRDGFLSGIPLPDEVREPATTPIELLDGRELLLRTCCQAVSLGLLTEAQVDLVLLRLLGSDLTLRQALDGRDLARVATEPGTPLF